MAFSTVFPVFRSFIKVKSLNRVYIQNQHSKLHQIICLWPSFNHFHFCHSTTVEYHSALWIMACTWWKNESHQMKLKDMSLDAVLHADSEYTLCSVIWLRWRIEKPRKSLKMPFLGSRENACSSLTVKAKNLRLVANDRQSSALLNLCRKTTWCYTGFWRKGILKRFSR